MGTSAQVDSLRKQLRVRDEQIRTLTREIEGVRAMAGLVEENLERAKADLSDHDRAMTVMMPIIEAAIELTRINDPCQWADSVRFDDLVQVSQQHYDALKAAVFAARDAVTAQEEYKELTA